MILNPYLLKCCDTLAEAEEYEWDKFLVTLVRIQQLLNRTAEIIPYSDDDAARRVQYTPIHMALTATQKELEALVRQQPPEVECNSKRSAQHLELSHDVPHTPPPQLFFSVPTIPH